MLSGRWLPSWSAAQLQTDAASTQGFDDCCDGHSELEVHLPCDGDGSPWRFIIVSADHMPPCCPLTFALLTRARGVGLSRGPRTAWRAAPCSTRRAPSARRGAKGAKRRPEGPHKVHYCTTT